MHPEFWRGKKVFLTGHTGFKGAWLSLWLQAAGSDVTGYSLAPPTDPSLFEIAGVEQGMRSIRADIRDFDTLRRELRAARPEIVIHMAAQSLVRESYRTPVETYATNVMGTVNVLEAARSVASARAVLIVTTDKCYENREWIWGYREHEPLGGRDPYSNSKACAELVTQAYRASFFAGPGGSDSTAGIASGRAGNVIGGGDWAAERLVPDAIRAFSTAQTVMLRNPNSVRPWQHVLDPLNGYLTLLEHLYAAPGSYSSGWNFGPSDADARDVQDVVRILAGYWGPQAKWQLDGSVHPHEANYLALDCTKAHRELNWHPTLALESALDWVARWHRLHNEGADMQAATLAQIADFEALLKQARSHSSSDPLIPDR
jgi:CDP-glucose 4,6-dehydratase